MTPSIETHIRSFGTGPRKVLAIHCTLSHGGAWRGMAQAFPDRWTFMACDLPGHGKSGDWDGTSDLFEQCLNAVSPQLQTPVDVIGHSFGAVVALGLAQKYPERIRRLCLFEPVLFAAAALDAPAVVEEYSEQSAPINDALLSRDLTTAARLFNRIWGDGTRWDDIPARTRAYITARMHLIVAQEATLFDDAAGVLSLEELAQVSMPVLLLHGAQSPPVARAIVRALAAQLPRAQSLELARVNHMAPITHPQEVADPCIRFLEAREETVDMVFSDRPVTHQSGG